MERFSERDLSKIIDKLKYSIRPDNYGRFKEKLLKRLFYKCMNEGVALYGQSDVSMESVASTIKEKYLEFNS